MPRRIDDYRGLTQPSRVKILHTIQKLPGQKLDQIAAETGLHINTARDHLKVLEEEGLIVSRPISTGVRGRPPVVFDPVQKPGDSETADQRARASQSKGDLLRRLYPALDRAEEIGSEAQHQIDTLYSHLEDVGLDPILDDENLDISVAPCTYHDLIDEDNSIVCSVHARLIQDQLSQVTGPLKLQKLLPFVTPHECKIMLAERAKAEPKLRKTGRQD